ncbi:DUF3987 domain-containing protein [Salmonella enterica]|nr:DUF3987 domain-containing protein [Salmonella enterica]EDR4377870.1 DUF3987 domain-containing protein [Salmonella enterica]EEA3736605.1 DUF3987 domain-containing protein [Salmonella enterica]EEF4027705.1 DUF3987 domain-containing protein [Salmonella enterica]EEG5734877.1 DUF3987 domain-containing protein [Salmonella enterica]
MENIIDPGDEYEYVYVLNEQNDNFPAGWGDTNNYRQLYIPAKTMPKPDEKGLTSVEFPLEALCEYAQNVCYQIKAEHGFDYSATACVIISAMAFAAQSFIQVKLPKTPEPTPVVIHSMYIANSGAGKSHLSKILLYPLRKYIDELSAIFEQMKHDKDAEIELWKVKNRDFDKDKRRNSSYPEVQEKAETEYVEHIKSKPVKPIMPPLLYENFDLDGAVIGLKEYPEGFFETTEGAELVNMSFRLIPLLNKSASGETYSRRIGKKTYVIKPNMSSLIMIQRGLFLQLLAKKDGAVRASGLMSRFIYYAHNESKDIAEAAGTGIPKEYPSTALEDYYQRFTSLLRKQGDRILGHDKSPKTTVHLTKEAEHHYNAKWKEVEARTKPGGRFFCIADIALKAPEIAVRIAASQKFFQDGDTSDIDVDELERAFQLMECLLEQAFSIYYPLSDENKEKCLFVERTRKLYEWIREHNIEPFPLQEIKRGLRFAREPEILHPLLEQLISQGEIVSAVYPFDRTIYVTWPAKDLNPYGKYAATNRYWGKIIRDPNNTESTGPYIDVSDIKARY